RDRFIQARQMVGEEELVDLLALDPEPGGTHGLPHFGLAEVGEFASIEHAQIIPPGTDNPTRRRRPATAENPAVEGKTRPIARSVSHASALPKSGSSPRSSMLR